MDVKLSIDDQEGVWMERRRKLEALTRDPLNQQQDDPAHPDKIMDPLLFSVAKEGDVDKFIKALEDHCANERVPLPVLLERRTPSKNTLLHAAAERDDNVRALIHFFPKHLIYRENFRGETPLHIAARAGKAVAVELLLHQGVTITPDCCGNSALHEAVRNCHHEVIGHLVSKDPSQLYCQNNESKSPLCVAVEKKDLKVLELLLDALDDGEDQERSDNERIFCISPVHLAIMYRKMDMLTKMWDKKSWLFQLRDAGNGTPLHLAAYENYLDGVKFLMEKCPTSALEQDNMDGYLPIHVACMMDNVRIVKELLRQWPDPAEFSARLGQNILHVSARHGSIAIVEYILKSPKFGHLINARDFAGNTPLHLAASHCQPSLVLLLQDGGVDKKLVNNDNMTVLDVVVRDLDRDMKVGRPPFGKWFTWVNLAVAKTPTSKDLPICQKTSRSPWKRFVRHWGGQKELADSRAVILALVASVTFTSGFSVPGGYNGPEGDAGIPILLHKVMYNVFVISNSMAMYGSIVSLMILLWSFESDPYIGLYAIFVSDATFLVTLAAVAVAFMAGVYVTTTKLAWLCIFVLVLGSVALLIFSSIFMLPYIAMTLGKIHPLIGRFTDQLPILILRRFGGETAVSGTAGRQATSVRPTRGDNPRPNLNTSFSA
ncbi:hypothetical protein BT93_K2106 [Corymbia citriodora subsp. variegata]|nr:hypothetical protein BT93_K2106 [Corymbia citriodora subsp. variegata]